MQIVTRPLPHAGWQVSHSLPEIDLHPNAPTKAITAAKQVAGNLTISDVHTGFMFTVVARSTSNDPSFSGVVPSVSEDRARCNGTVGRPSKASPVCDH
jgi:hypothetical protein